MKQILCFDYPVYVLSFSIIAYMAMLIIDFYISGDESIIKKLFKRRELMGRFEIKPTASGKGFYFVLIAKNGEIIATSEVYNTKEACIVGIKSVKKNAPKAKIVE